MYRRIYTSKGQKRTVNNTAVSRHIDTLRKSGMTYALIAQHAGVSTSSVARAHRKTPTSEVRKKSHINGVVVYRETAAAIMKVGPLAPVGSLVKTRILTSVIPSARKLQALQVMGWEIKVIAEKTGISYTTLYTIANYDSKARDPKNITKRTTCRTHMLIDEAYNELYMTKGPSATAKSVGRNKRRLPPLAWDNIDDINEKVAYSLVVNRGVRRSLHNSKKVA